MSGHSVLAVPVPALEGFVRERTERYDASFVSTDPDFGHAHVTVLGPWLADPTPADLGAVAGIVAAEPAFDFTLASVRRFPDGVLYLAPEPDEPFRRLTDRLGAAFPQTPPYGGEFPDTIPHLTVDHTLTGATPASLTAELVLPVPARGEVVQLQWWANHGCRILDTWRLGR